MVSDRIRRRAITVLTAVLLANARPAHAQTTPTDPAKRAAAQALFDAGRQLATQGQYDKACPKLLESYSLDAAMGTKFYLAECYEHIGKLASAWTYYLDVAEEAHGSGAADREKFANDKAASLKPRLPQLTVTLGRARGVAGLVVQRDGIVIGEGMLDTPIPVDLGSHTVTVKAPGKKPWETHVEAKKEGDALRVEIPVLESVEVDTGPKSGNDTPPVETPPPESPKQRTAGFVLGGIGIASLAGGFAAGGIALSKRNASNATGFCTGNTCTTQGLALRTDAIHAATASTALVVIGAAGLGVGALLLITAPSTGPKGAGSAPPQPEVSLGLGTIAARWRF